MSFKRKTSKYYIHKEIELIIIKLFNIKQMYYVYKKIKFKNGYNEIYNNLPSLSNMILSVLLDKIILELSGLVVDHDDEDLCILGFIYKYNEYKNDYHEMKYIYIKEIDTGKKHRLYLNTDSISDVMSDLEKYIKQNEKIIKYIKKSRDKLIAHNDKKIHFNKNFKYDDMKKTITYDEFNSFIEDLYKKMNNIYCTLFKTQFAYSDNFDSEMKYLNNLLLDDYKKHRYYN